MKHCSTRLPHTLLYLRPCSAAAGLWAAGWRNDPAGDVGGCTDVRQASASALAELLPTDYSKSEPPLDGGQQRREGSRPAPSSGGDAGAALGGREKWQVRDWAGELWTRG